ncbi:MAG: carbohydrate-binding family 9-like protein [Smithella sp.]
MDIKKYSITFTKQPSDIDSPWDGNVWKDIPVLEVSCYRKESSPHRPQTRCKLLYDCERIYGIFQVNDQYVRCVHAEFQSEVCKDSCVEFFVQPKASSNYFNFEFNCGGALLASYVIDPTRIDGKVSKFIPLTPEDNREIKRYHSLPRTVEPEITHPITWFLGFSIPFTVLKKYTGLPDAAGGDVWRANFYKCGNETSHPHWGSWSPVRDLNFHLPADFGEIQFAPQ